MEPGLIRVSVVTFLHDGAGKYLIGKRSQNCRDEKGVWEPLGSGALRFGETVVQGALREVKEEACAAATNLEFMGYRDVHRTQAGENTHWIALDFRAKVDPKDVSIGEPHKCDEIRRVTTLELQTMDTLHSQFPLFLEKYKAIL